MSRAATSAGKTARRTQGAAGTPLMAQYSRIKQEHPDAFLFFRLGDFYEMFFEDAQKAAQLLGLTLTSRNRNDPDPIPMCGIPWHQRDPYVARLLRMGHKVAICDQLEDASASRGLVERGVTEILTPGSVTGDAFLDPVANNFLAAVFPGDDGIGVCLVDASTGEVKLAQADGTSAAEWIGRLNVSEWVHPEAGALPEVLGARLQAVLGGQRGVRTPVPLDRFARLDLGTRWPEQTLREFADVPLALDAARGALDYVDRMQGGAALQLTRVERWRDDDRLQFDAATARHLELFEAQPGGQPSHTLWHHLNVCVTALGARRLRGWVERPLAGLADIRERQGAVAAWKARGVERTAFRETLKGFPDLERLAARIVSGRATPRDLASVRDGLKTLPDVLESFAAVAAAEAQRGALRGIPELERILEDALVDDPPVLSGEGRIIRTGWDSHRDELYDLAHSGKRWIAELEAGERQRTGIPSLKVGFNRVFGYYLEVTRPHLDKVPDDYERRQTLTSAERFVTPGLKTRESEILGAEEKLRAREQELFVDLREKAAGHVEHLQRIADALAILDAQAALAEAAARFGWVRPDVGEGDAIVLGGARHPVVERLMPRGEFVPNGVEIGGPRRQILLLTGPNMGGKSTYLRQLALIVLLAQAGSFVPCERAEIGKVDRLFTRVGAGDRLGAGQSTFMVEMQETAGILRSATSRSLVLLDELGRGTATYDGLALAWAVTEHLHDSREARPRTIFATHYHELTQLAGRLPRLANIHVTVREWGEDVVFLHRVAEGAADRSYGIHVGRLAGLPAKVLERASEVLAELESERTAEHLTHTASPAAGEPQLPLFSAGPHPLERELAALDPETMTPLEALARIAAWKKRFGAS